MKSVFVFFLLFCILVPAYCFADETMTIESMKLCLGMTKSSVEGLIAKNGYILEKDDGVANFYNILMKIDNAPRP
jgi:hypothetical protein